MHGAGNDYVYVDCFGQDRPDNPAQLAPTIADRRFGVGGDGLILICPAENADAEMQMFNADGSQAEMCGNGIRCVARYLFDHQLAPRAALQIVSGGRTYDVRLNLADYGVESVTVDMGEPILQASQIPTTLPGNPPIDAPLKWGQGQLRATCLSMGNPHCVIFVDEATDELVTGAGPAIEEHASFPKRVNVEFVELVNPTLVRQRTWERGSGETLACGTGACAVCVAGVLTGRTQRRLTVSLRGGNLVCQWRESDNHVLMTGPAVEVFSGVWPDDGPA